jgi:glycosyltransferase involved in cell wall biosynthesis
MRILVAHQVPRARTGGMSRLMGFIHDRIADAGHDIDYLCADDVPSTWASWYGRRVAFPMAVRSRAIQADRAGRPYDIVNVHEPSAAPSLLGRRSSSPAVVVTSHGLERRAWELAKEEGLLGREGPGWRTRLTYPPSALWPGDIALRRADHVFCLNNEDQNILVTDFGRSPQTITRIMPGADPVYARAADGRDYSQATRLLFAATWRKNKGIEDLVPSFIALAERHPRLILNVVGAGAAAHTILSQFPESVRTRVLCDTPADEDATAAAFAQADVFVLPSLFEGTPLTLMQAMMSGLPIVTTSTCGMKDVIEDGKTGILVPIRSPQAVAAAVESLVGSPVLRKQLGSAAREAAVRHYTWDHAAAPVLQAYEALQ